MGRFNETSGVDQGLIGHVVSIHHHDSDFHASFPAVTLGGLALELAEMLRGAYPHDAVRVFRCGLFSGQRSEAEAVTERIKRRVIEARDAVNPGRAFMEGIGYRFEEESEEETRSGAATPPGQTHWTAPSED
ncbi:hypothetical protein [Stutzerimonas kunmingensis]|uniref:hypothetical protein n=1 Tax=Stutzerimonas kunmingensis TaxID=1211807 RepID=UPI0028B1F1C3|nr:hypothetical protein [Stutzerimonas kunmingensis]